MIEVIISAKKDKEGNWRMRGRQNDKIIRNGRYSFYIECLDDLTNEELLWIFSDWQRISQITNKMTTIIDEYDRERCLGSDMSS